MEVDLGMIKWSEEKDVDQEDECVTPRDGGSRIPPPTVCPPAPRKKRAVFDVKKRQKAAPKESPGNKEEFSIDEAALELLFALHGTAKKRNKRETDRQGNFSPRFDSDFSKF